MEEKIMAMAPQQQQPQGAGGSFGQLVNQISSQLGMLQQVVAKARPEQAEQFAQIQEMFQQSIEALQGNKEDEGEEMSPKKPNETASPEAGAADVMPY
jgi:hypothetical protein